MFLTKEMYFLMKVKYFLLTKVKYFSMFFLCININKNGGLVVLLMWLPDGFVGVTNLYGAITLYYVIQSIMS